MADVSPGATFTLHWEENTTTMYDSRIDMGIQVGVGLNFKLSDRAVLSSDLVHYRGSRNLWGGFRKNNNASFNVGILWSAGKK